MTPHVLIAGSLFRHPTQRLSKGGKLYTTATVKVVVGTDFQFWNVIAWSESAQAELLRLEEGDAVSVQGTFKAEIREYAGEKRIGLSLTAENVLALRQPPPPPRPKECRRPVPARGAERPAPPFDDDIPFGEAP